MNHLTERDLLELLDWPIYEFETTRPLASDQPLRTVVAPAVTRPDKPKQALQSHSPGLRRTAAETLCWLLGVLVACGLVFIILAAFALGMRDLVRLALGSP